MKVLSSSDESPPKYYHVESRILLVFEIINRDYSKETFRIHIITK